MVHSSNLGNGEVLNCGIGTYGFDTEAVYGLEPEAGPSTVIPALTYEGESLTLFKSNLITHLPRLDPPATTRPYVPPGYETQDEWNVPPAMTQPAYTSLGELLSPSVSI